MLKGYGYKKIGFILDRGYSSKKNIQYMDSCKYDFVIMVKGMASFIEKIILENYVDAKIFIEFVAMIVQ